MSILDQTVILSISEKSVLRNGIKEEILLPEIKAILTQDNIEFRNINNSMIEENLFWKYKLIEEIGYEQEQDQDSSFKMINMLDKYKENMTDGDYLNFCNMIRDKYNNKSKQSRLIYINKPVPHNHKNKLEILTVQPTYLYHSTAVYNEKSISDFEYWNVEIPDYKMPEFGKFSERLDNIKKHFTITPLCNYTFYGIDAVFLQYKVIKPLKLLDVRAVSCFAEWHRDIDILIEKFNLDGFLNKQDCTEISLYRASDCVDSNYKILPFKDEEHDECYECQFLNIVSN